MTRDAEKVAALLGSMLEWIPGPQTHRSNPLCSRPDSGEAPSASKPCPACNGNGTFGPKHRTCHRCKGQGTLTVDAYTGKELQTAHGHLRAMTDQELTTHLTRLASQASIRAGQESTDWYTAAADRRDHLYTTGSYHELEQALHRLEHAQPIAAGMVIAFLVYGSTAIRSHRVQAVLDASCELLAHWTPKPIRVPPWAHTQPPTRLERMRQLQAQGLTLTQIGKRYGITKQRVSQILKEAA